MRTLIFMLVGALASAAQAAPQEAVWALAQKEKPAVIETLRELVNIESGSRDKEGLDRLAALLGERLAALGAKVEFYEPNAADTYRLFDTPKEIGKVVVARFQGSGARRIMLLAHMDTVYPRGTLAKRPFRVEGARAYGPGIADDKGGVALILHALAMLKAMDYRGYGTLTVVINGDEEISSPGARAFIQRAGAEHDFVFSCEPTLATKEGGITLATSGVGQATLTVRGKSAHAGVNPELGRNAIVELAPGAQTVYAELGLKLPVDESGNGGGTDAAFAAASGKPAVAESFGFAGFGYHSSEEEYVELDSIEPRLYLMTRLIMDASR